MVELQSPNGWGTAKDPETDVRVSLDGDVDADVARRLVERYDRIRAVGGLPEAEDEPSAAALDGERGALPFNPESHTNDEVEDKVQDIDDEAELAALLSLEEEQQGRSGATDAIEARLAAVREAEE